MKTAIDPADVIALIPAAGFGTRFPGQGSKEVYVLGADARGQPILLIDNLLRHLVAGGVNKVVLVTRPEKTDIPETLGDGSSRGLNIQYPLTPPTPSSPHTLNAAHPRVRGSVVVLGFPDIVFVADDAVKKLLAALAVDEVDVVLGLTPTTSPTRVDVVTHECGLVRKLVIKPVAWSGNADTWVMAAWKPVFTEFLHDTLAHGDSISVHEGTAPAKEMYVGDIIQKFIDLGKSVAAVNLSAVPGIDAGTVEGLADLERRYPEISIHRSGR